MLEHEEGSPVHHFAINHGAKTVNEEEPIRLIGLTDHLMNASPMATYPGGGTSYIS